MSTQDLAKDPTGPIKMIYVEFIEFFARIADDYYTGFYGFDQTM